MREKTSKRIIKKWQVFTFAAGISLLLVFSAFLYYSSEKKSILEDKQHDIKAIADLKIGQLIQWRKERTSDLFIVSQSTLFSRGVKQWLNNRKDLILEEELKEQLRLINSRYGYKNIYLASTRGESLFSLDSNENTLNSITSSAVVEAAKNGQIIFTDFYFCTIHHQIHCDIIAPIADDKNNPVAALVFRIDPNDFLYPLIQSWPTPSKTSETLLVRKDGDSVLYLNELRHVKNTALRLHESLSKTEIPAVRAALGYTGIFEGKDYRGIDVLAYIEPVTGTPWLMVAKVDKSEIYAELQYRAFMINLMTIVLILLTAVSLIMIYNSRQKIIYRQLYTSEKELTAKQEEFRTTLYSIGDGVITSDIHGNLVQINHVAEQLTGWSEKDAAGKPLEEIFRIINEETRNKVENPVDKVLREGVVVGLANHTLLVSKNGSEIPIADSGAPIRNQAGNITGVVLVFRDQTNERQAARALEQSEATIRNKLKAITLPVGDIGSLELSDIIDIEAIQSILDDFYKLTGFLGAVLDTSGKVLVAVGWQDICTKFHRCNPESLKNCLESDTILTSGVPEGVYKRYRCKNNLWDMVTPLIIGDRHVGNIFIGQFFYTDEQPDIEIFRKQAQRYGFDEKEYLDALSRVPHFSQENVDLAMQFYARLTSIISRLSFSAIQQSRLLAQHQQAEITLKESEEKFRNFFEYSPIGKSITGMDGTVQLNRSFCNMLGYTEEELKSAKWQELTHPDDIQQTAAIMQSLVEREIFRAHFEKRYLHKNGHIVWVDVSSYLHHDGNGEPQYFITTMNDITRRKNAEDEAYAAREVSERSLKVAENSRRLLLSVVEDEKNARQELKSLNNELESKIAERTKDLSDKNGELQRMNKLFVDRELRMVELKQKIKNLEETVASK